MIANYQFHYSSFPFIPIPASFSASNSTSRGSQLFKLSDENQWPQQEKVIDQIYEFGEGLDGKNIIKWITEKLQILINI